MIEVRLLKLTATTAAQTHQNETENGDHNLVWWMKTSFHSSSFSGPHQVIKWVKCSIILLKMPTHKLINSQQKSLTLFNSNTSFPQKETSKIITGIQEVVSLKSALIRSTEKEEKWVSVTTEERAPPTETKETKTARRLTVCLNQQQGQPQSFHFPVVWGAQPHGKVPVMLQRLWTFSRFLTQRATRRNTAEMTLYIFNVFIVSTVCQSFIFQLSYGRTRFSWLSSNILTFTFHGEKLKVSHCWNLVRCELCVFWLQLSQFLKWSNRLIRLWTWTGRPPSAANTPPNAAMFKTFDSTPFHSECPGDGSRGELMWFLFMSSLKLMSW